MPAPYGQRGQVVRIADLVVLDADRHHHGVVVAVVGAEDLHDRLAARVRARDPDRVHRRLRAGVRVAPLRQVPAAHELLGDDDRVLGRRREVGAVLVAVAQRAADRGVRVALDHRAEAVVEVPHLVAVDVPHLRAGPALEVDRPRIAQLVRRRDARAQHLVGAAVHLGRRPGPVVELLLLALDQLLDAAAVQRDGRRHGHARSPRRCPHVRVTAAGGPGRRGVPARLRRSVDRAPRGKRAGERTDPRAGGADPAAILRPVVFELRDGPRDECGVFGIHSPGSDVARLTYFALYALQHRGQESAGIAVAQGGHIMAMRDKGLVNQVFDEQKLRVLRGDMAVGHVRYSTTGANSWENTQPVWRADRREVALAHNGNLINAVELHARAAVARGDVPLHLGLRDHRRPALHPRGRADRGRRRRRDDAARGRVLHGGHDEGPRRGVPRPGRPATALARHARRAVLRRVGDLRVRHHRRELPARRAARRGRLALARRGSGRGWRSPARRRALCVFEHIYFARPDSRLGGQVLQVSRGRMGELLARRRRSRPTS